MIISESDLYYNTESPGCTIEIYHGNVTYSVEINEKKIGGLTDFKLQHIRCLGGPFSRLMKPDLYMDLRH